MEHAYHVSVTACERTVRNYVSARKKNYTVKKKATFPWNTENGHNDHQRLSAEQLELRKEYYYLLKDLDNMIFFSNFSTLENTLVDFFIHLALPCDYGKFIISDTRNDRGFATIYGKI